MTDQAAQAENAMRLGVTLPHFGEHARADCILDRARECEALGFHSLWVRDHLVLKPTAYGPSSATYFEALTVLSAVGAVTKSVQLGTAALVPFRHPVHAALIASTLTNLYGPRLILGVGTGSDDSEFATVGLDGVPRAELLDKSIRIMRRLWSETDVGWDDDTFSFAGASLEPPPQGGTVPLWYCGSSPKGARIAAASYDGWLPGRIPLRTLQALIPKLRKDAAVSGRDHPVVGTIPATSIASTREAALATIDVEALLVKANSIRYWKRPASGRFETVEDLDGLVLYGTPEDVLAQCLRLRDAGVDHIVFDFRMSFDRWQEQIELLAGIVLPGLASIPRVADAPDSAPGRQPA